VCLLAIVGEVREFERIEHEQDVRDVHSVQACKAYRRRGVEDVRRMWRVGTGEVE